MAKFDDMIYELAISADKPRYWAKQMRSEARKLMQSSTQYESVGQGIKTPFIEAGGGRFDTLPHEGAALANLGTPTSVASGTWTVPTYDAESASGATWSHGMQIDVANGLIHFTGVPRGAILLFTAWATFEAHATGNRQIKWTEVNGGSIVVNVKDNLGVGDTTYVPISHLRRVGLADTTYKIEVAHWAAENIDVNTYFTCIRMR